MICLISKLGRGMMRELKKVNLFLILYTPMEIKVVKYPKGNPNFDL